MLITRFVIFLVFCYQCVLGSNKLCDLENSECLTAAAKRIKEFSSAQPLHVEMIEAVLPTTQYTLNNITLSGIDTCDSELVKIDPKNMMYDYHVVCKHLVMNGLYVVSGKLGPLPIEGTGDFQVDYDDYAFLFNGEFEYADKDNKLHYHIKNFKLDIETRGQIIYDFKNLFNGDKEKAAALQKYVRENGQTVNKILRQPVMTRFMTLFIERVNAYLQKVPVEELFTEA